MRINTAGICKALKQIPFGVFEYYYERCRQKEGRNFDRKFNTDTQSTQKEVEIYQSFDPDQFHHYDPTEINTLKRSLHALAICYEEFLFIDVGSGKGRVLLLASDFPFKKILGVEISHHYHEIARKNIALYKSKTQKCFNLESIRMDAVQFSIPKEKIIFFLFNPFQKRILAQFLFNLEKSLKQFQRKIFIIYVNPCQSQLMENIDFLNLIKQEKGRDVYTTYHLYESSEKLSRKV